MTEAAPSTGSTPPVDRAARILLTLAAVAVAFAAADTYVVVLALPDMMTASGLGLDELQRAAPIVSGFLLGYVAVLPLVGRIADLRGRRPVLVGSLVLFAVGSVVTAAADGLGPMVVGRFLQGVGGGGLVPATLALVADLWPPRRRGVPLGIVGAVQELGSVVGPLYGAAVLAFADWRAIFWLNCAAGLVLAAAIAASGRPRSSAHPTRSSAHPTRSSRREAIETPSSPPVERRGLRRAAERGTSRSPKRVETPPPDLVGALLAVLAVTALALAIAQPAPLRDDVEIGTLFLPVVGELRWTTPIALITYALFAAFIARELTARRPLVAMRAWPATARAVDLTGALLLAVVLGCVIVAFASADPEHSVVSPAAPWLLAVAAGAAVAFVLRQRTAKAPLIPRGTLRERPAWGALVVSFFVGGALIAALVDVPFFARLTEHRDSQLAAALVLVEFLIAIPVGAVVGGYATRWIRPGWIAAGGMALASGCFVVMAGWERDALSHPSSVVALALAGFGFGLAVAPVNAALLDATPPPTHGIASALVVVARMVGMLVGISALTSWGLRAYHAAVEDIPPLSELCPDSATACKAYNGALIDAGIVQLSTVFTGAAVCAGIAAVAAAVLLSGRRGERAVESS
ncbi:MULTISPECIES: MFS transporter [Mumia]|uniref:MFS transporter n=1 Tax=Mumia TaxID=1546255 RepID=UPI001E3A689B|nr:MULTISPECIES: MFS transporter [Mumia]